MKLSCVLVVSTVHARENLVQECHFARTRLTSRAIALYSLELHVQSKICLSEIQSFLLLKRVKCLI